MGGKQTSVEDNSGGSRDDGGNGSVGCVGVEARSAETHCLYCKSTCWGWPPRAWVNSEGWFGVVSRRRKAWERVMSW